VVKKVEQILISLDAYGGTFWEIGEHAPIAGIRNGMQAFKDSGADIIVSVGGGSPIDASKAIIYNLQQESGGAFLRQISLPTTLSAAEYTVSRYTLVNIIPYKSPQIGAGFMNDEGVKVSVSSQELAPAGVILDAELTLPTPERLWSVPRISTRFLFR
jgi:alcohol dehydrogenase class IV